MQNLKDSKEISKIVERRYPQPSLNDFTPTLIEKLKIKSPNDLFEALDYSREKWADFWVSHYEGFLE